MVNCGWAAVISCDDQSDTASMVMHRCNSVLLHSKEQEQINGEQKFDKELLREKLKEKEDFISVTEGAGDAREGEGGEIGIRRRAEITCGRCAFDRLVRNKISLKCLEMYFGMVS